MRQPFLVTQHAVDQYVERFNPGTTPERARCVLERRIKRAKRLTTANPRQLRKAHQSSTRYYYDHELVFVVDLESRQAVTVLHRAWFHKPESPATTNPAVSQASPLLASLPKLQIINPSYSAHAPSTTAIGALNTQPLADLSHRARIVNPAAA